MHSKDFFNNKQANSQGSSPGQGVSFSAPRQKHSLIASTRIFLTTLLCWLLLSACSLTEAPPPQLLFDLAPADFALQSPSEAHSQLSTDPGEEKKYPPKGFGVEIGLKAPSWLANRQIGYRLLYRDQHQRLSYSQSRWAAEPPEMISLALNRGLAQVEAGRVCRLDIRLDEFIQLFKSESESSAILVARGEMFGYDDPERRVLQRDFLIEEEAPSADASGGVAAKRAALDRLLNELRGWLKENCIR